jgi:hypothetical protein
VQTRASQNSVDGFRDGVLRVRVTAAPTGGEANAAVVRLLAKAAGVGTTSVAIVRGHSSRQKLIAFEGVSEQDLRAKLGEA